MVLRGRVLAPLFCLCVAVWGSPTDARAASEADKNAAAALADAGLAGYLRGDAAAALDLFVRATALVPAPTFALFEARCLVVLDRLDEAERAYERAELFDAGPSPTPAQRRAIAEATSEHAALRRRRAQRARVVASFVASPAPAAAPQETGRESAAPAASSQRSGQKIAALVAVGAGATGIVVGIASGLVMLERKRALDDACPEQRCASSNASALDAYRNARNVSTVAWSVGLVGVTVGAGLWLTAPKSNTSSGTSSPRPPPLSVSISPSTRLVVAGPVSVAVTGTF